MFPELVELIIRHAWDCLSTSSHRHGHSMTQWMLVSRDWLKIVISVVFRDLWITSYAHFEYIMDICSYNMPSSVCEIAGITSVRVHLAEMCRSLTISVYTGFEGQYTSQCRELIEYATTDSPHDRLLSGIRRCKTQNFSMPTGSISAVIRDHTPLVKALHFVLVDCVAIYGGWNTFAGPIEYPLSLTELHITFAYTSPPPTLLLDAPRGTFFPPPDRWDLPTQCCFHGVRRLFVWDANTDFVAFLTTACPRLETVASTADFRMEDVPPDVPVHVKDRLVFLRLPRTRTWGLTGTDTIPIPERWPTIKELIHLKTKQDWAALSGKQPLSRNPPTKIALRKRMNSIWRVLKRIGAVQERN